MFEFTSPTQRSDEASSGAPIPTAPLCKECADLRGALIAAKREAVRLKNVNAVYSEFHHALSRWIRGIFDCLKVEADTNANEAARARCESTQGRLNVAVANALTKFPPDAEYRHATDIVNAVTRAATELMQTLRSTRSRANAEAETELKRIQTQLETVQRELAVCAVQRDEASARAVDLNRQLQDRERDADAMRARIQELQNRVKELEDLDAQTTEAGRDLQNRFGSVQTHRDRLQNDLIHANLLERRLKLQLQNLQTMYDDLEVEKAQIEEQLATLRAQTQALQTQAQETVDQLQEKLEEVTAEWERLNQDIQAQSEAIRAVQGQLRDCKADRERIQASLDECEREKGVCLQELAKQVGFVSDLNKKLGESRELIQDLEQKNLALDAENTELKETNRNLELRVADLSQQNRDLQERCNVDLNVVEEAVAPGSGQASVADGANGSDVATNSSAANRSDVGTSTDASVNTYANDDVWEIFWDHSHDIGDDTHLPKPFVNDRLRGAQQELDSMKRALDRFKTDGIDNDRNDRYKKLAEYFSLYKDYLQAWVKLLDPETTLYHRSALNKDDQFVKDARQGAEKVHEKWEQIEDTRDLNVSAEYFKGLPSNKRGSPASNLRRTWLSLNRAGILLTEAGVRTLMNLSEKSRKDGIAFLDKNVSDTGLCVGHIKDKKCFHRNVEEDSFNWNKYGNRPTNILWDDQGRYRVAKYDEGGRRGDAPEA